MRWRRRARVPTVVDCDSMLVPSTAIGFPDVDGEFDAITQTLTFACPGRGKDKTFRGASYVNGVTMFCRGKWVYVFT